jgi:hypothetical protein
MEDYLMKRESNDIELALLDEPVFHEMSKIPCDSPERARRFVAVAYRCLQGMPVGVNLTPFAIIQNRPILVEGVKLVERWLIGEPIGPEQFQDAHGIVLAAAKETGFCNHDMTGVSAAYWAVVFLVEAAWNATRNSDCTNEAASRANSSVRYAYRTSPSPEAIEFINARFGSIIGFGNIEDDGATAVPFRATRGNG